MITEKLIIDAYVFLRRTNNSIPDEVLDFIKDSSIAALTQQVNDNKLLAIALIQAVLTNDWEIMLKHFPEGVEHRTYKYTKSEDYEDWESYEDFSRYIEPARRLLIDKCLSKAIALLLNQ